MSSNVFVINQNGHPLMPCHPAKARKLLREGKARVIGRCPFTIKLLWDCEEQIQEVVLGVDKGSHSTGFCCVGKLTLKVQGVSGHLDQIAMRTMQGKSYLYAALGAHTPLSTLFGYQTATLRKARGLPKTHDADALCLAIYATGELVPYDRESFYSVSFRPCRTRRQYYDLPRKGQGRVRYQVNNELEGFRKGDVVRVKGKYIKQINSIYSNGYLAFQRMKGEPNQARPQDCQLLERGCTMLWEKGA